MELIGIRSTTLHKAFFDLVVLFSKLESHNISFFRAGFGLIDTRIRPKALHP